MADRRKLTTQTQRIVFELLEFEKPITELETKISELETLSHNTELNLNGEIQPLRDRLKTVVKQVFANLTPWQQVQVARAPGRPLAMDYVRHMCSDWMELHGDRGFRDDPAVVTGLARIGDKPVLIVAHRKGKETKEKIRFNFGCAHPEGYRKALRKMQLAEKFGLPIVCLINTPGAYPGIGAEERGQAWAIAENLQAMFALRVPVVCVVIGEGGSGGALGVGIGDRVLMLQHAYYSVISPEGCAAILWGDSQRAADAAGALRLGARDLHELEIVDEVVEEIEGAAHRDPEATMEAVSARIQHHLAELQKIPIDDLLTRRYDKFRRMGTLFSDVAPEPPSPPSEEDEEKEVAPSDEAKEE